MRRGFKSASKQVRAPKGAQYNSEQRSSVLKSKAVLNQRGGEGSNDTHKNIGISTPPPPASAAAQPSASASSSNYATYVNIAATRLPPKLPVSAQQTAQQKQNLARLGQLYDELKHVEAAIYWTGKYLPKLNLNEQLKAHKLHLQAEIQKLAQHTESTTCQDSSSSKPTR